MKADIRVPEACAAEFEAARARELADSFNFPRRKRKVLPWLRFRHRTRRIVARVLPRLGARHDQDRFESLMEFASFDEFEHSYKLPTALHDEQSSDW